MQIKIGISSCLLGESVRYDGSHKRNDFLVNTLGRFVKYVPVCPEVECGMPIPREAVRLVGTLESHRMITQKTKRDLTDQMLTWADKKLNLLEKEDLCGFIFKAKSPSSGMDRVKIYNEEGNVHAYGAGMFAREFMKRFPLLPVEDEGRLFDPDLRENFIERIFTLARYRELMGTGTTVHNLMIFHEQHKQLLMAHNEKICREMGRLLAAAVRHDAMHTNKLYEDMLLKALKNLATPARHTNVMMHMMGYFKDMISADEKKELLDLIFRYKSGDLPLIVPVTLIKHFVGKYQVSYLVGQVYLNPHPLELRLRNHA